MGGEWGEGEGNGRGEEAEIFNNEKKRVNRPLAAMNRIQITFYTKSFTS